MNKLTPPKEVLRGSILGEDHAADFARLTATAAKTENIVLLSFVGIEAVTASYLKAFLSPLLGEDAVNKCEAGLFPLVTEMSDDVREDLHSFLNDKGWLLSEVKESGGNYSFVRLIGCPESATEKTFLALRMTQGASATDLFELCEEKNVNQTAWNNRLMNLLRLRLAKRTKEGRVWIYQTTSN